MASLQVVNIHVSSLCILVKEKLKFLLNYILYFMCEIEDIEGNNVQYGVICNIWLKDGGWGRNTQSQEGPANTKCAQLVTFF